MNKKLSVIFYYVILFFLFLISSNKVMADEVEEAVKSSGFTYRIKHPDNQIGLRSALNLNMSIAQKQQIIVEVENFGEENITVNLSLNGARTNGNGGLEYGPNKFEKDTSMKYDLPDLVNVPKSVDVPSKSIIEFPIDIVMPEVPYDGIVTGGVQLQRVENENLTTEDSKGQTIVNKIAYLFGITLQMTDTDVVTELDLKKVYPSLSNFRNAIFLDVANITATRVKNLIMDVGISKKDKDEILYESKRTSMEMSPNSLMKHPVSLGGQEMEPGNYTAHVVATSGDREWRWTKDFKITREEAEKFNEQDVSIVQERGLDIKLVAIIVSVSLFVILGIYLFVGKRNKKKEEKLESAKKGNSDD